MDDHEDLPRILMEGVDPALCTYEQWLSVGMALHDSGHPCSVWDNLQKLLKDVMTECHFWMDDAQVASEIAEKFWVHTAPGIYVEVQTLEAVEGADG